LPSLINAKSEIDFFLSKGHINFPDEVTLGKALPYVYFAPKPTYGITHLEKIADASVRSIISQSGNGYLAADETRELMKAAGIDVVKERVCVTEHCLQEAVRKINFPVAMKVTGPVHKTEVGGVSLNVNSAELMEAEFNRLMRIPAARGVLIQQMLEGEELFVGAVRQSNFGHLIVCGLGGIFVEVLNDISYGLAPLTRDEARTMVRSLKGYKIIEGYRSKEGVSEELFIDAIVKIASLVHLAPEISELDINPFMANQHQLVAVDVRVNIEK
jgi:acetate---CoA ligase (ADP-forming)